MNHKLGFACSNWIAAVAVVAGLVASSARADVNWVIQASLSPVTFSGVIGNAAYNYNNQNVISQNGSTLWNEQYTAVPQTDPGTSLNNGFSTSTVTAATGLLTTVGNTFLSSLNFGSTPAQPGSYSAFAPTTSFGINGNWLPNGTSAGGTIGNYGTATPAQAGFTFVGSNGTNQNGQQLSPTPGGGPLDPGGGPNGLGTAGRFQFAGTAGISNSAGVATPVTAGAFDGSILQFTGVAGFAVNYEGDMDFITGKDNLVMPLSPQTFFDNYGINSLPNLLSGPAAAGSITRGTSPTAYQYIMTTPYKGELILNMPNNDNNAQNIGSSTSIDFKFTATFHAVANLQQGDVNFDGIVNGLDIAQVASHWLQSNPQHLGAGDGNGDGLVNGLDIALIASHWLQTTPPLGGGGGGGGAAVPEPATVVLAAFACLVFLVPRRVWAGRRG